MAVGQCNAGDDMADDEDPESKRRSFSHINFIYSIFNIFFLSWLHVEG